MAGYYTGKLQASQEYINLKDAYAKIAPFASKIQELIASLEQLDGDVISEIKNNIIGLFDEFVNFGNKLNDIITKLDSNASDGDSVLAEWEGKIGAELGTPVYSNMRGSDGIGGNYICYKVVSVISKVEGTDEGIKVYSETITYICDENGERDPAEAFRKAGSDVGIMRRTEGEVQTYNFKGAKI